MFRLPFRRLSTSACLCIAAALLALSLAPGEARAEDYKIGVINVDRILRESGPAREAQKRIEQEFQGRDAALAKQEKDLRDAATRFEKDAPTLSESDRGARQRDLELRGRDLERQRRQLAEDLRTRQFDEMNKLKERLDGLLTRIAKEQNYDLILQDGVFIGRTVDITETVIKALATP